MTHQPKTLALLISLIGVGAASTAHASTTLDVPSPGPLDVVRWTPGLQWLRAEEGVIESGSPAVDSLAPSDAAQPRGWVPAAATDFAPLLLEVTSPTEVTADVVGPAAEADGSPTALSQPRSLVSAARSAGGRLKAAGTTVMARLAAAPSRDGAVADVSDQAAVARALPDAGCAEAPSSNARDSAHDDWLRQCLALALPGDTATQAQTATWPEVATRIAERFPAAVPQREATDAPARRRHAALLVERRDVVVVATEEDKVLHRLAAVLGMPRAAPGAAPALPPSEKVVVTTQIERVLETLSQVSDARRVAHVQAKRLAHERAKAAAAQVAALEHSPRIEVAADIDIDIGRLTAPPPSLPAQPLGGRKLAVGDTTLDRVRGGFVSNGLNISFGIDRAVYVNGELVTSTRLTVSGMGVVSSGPGSGGPLDAATMALIQNGSGNTVATGTLSSGNLGTVIQNTLDGQNINNLTVINATVNSLGVLRGLNLQSSLRSAVIDSLRR